MGTVDVDQWLEQWVEEHISAAGHVVQKAEERDAAKACAGDAAAAGIAMAALKMAADGDLETSLAERRNVLAPRDDGDRPA